MKLNENFVLRQVADNWVVFPVGDAVVDFNGMLTLNGSGAMLWRILEQQGDREALVKALTDIYEVSQEQALADVDAFLQKLRDAGCLDA